MQTSPPPSPARRSLAAPLTLAVAGALVFAFAFWLGRRDPASTAPLNASRNPLPILGTPTTPPPATPAPLAERLRVVFRDSDVHGWMPDLMALALGFSSEDFPRALAAAEELADRGQRLRARNALLQLWAEGHPEAAFAWAAGQPAKERNRDLLLVLSTWAAADPVAALERALAGVDGTRPDGLVAGVLQGWSERDPAAALDYFLRHPELPRSDRGSRLAFQLARNLDRAAADDALTKFAALPLSPLRSQLLEGTIMAWADEDPAAALDAAARQLDPLTLARVFQSTGYNWGRKDPASAAELVGQMPPGITRGAFAEAVYAAWARQDPVAAAAALARLPGELQPTGAMPVAFGLARRDPEAAKAWAMDLTDPYARSQATSATAGAIAQSDPSAAAAWVATLAGTALHDGAARTFGWTVVGQKPAMALDAANRMQDPTARAYYLRTFSREGRAADPEAVQAWLAAAPLTAAERRELTATPSPTPR